MMGNKIWFVAVAFLLLGRGATAQINESDTVKFQLRAALSGNYQQGNVALLNLRSRLDFLFAPNEVWALKSQNSSLYQAFYGQKADNDLFSRNYLYFRPQRRVYPFAMAYVSTNFRRKIERRYFAGAGATWQAINARAWVLKFSGSVVHESTAFGDTRYNYPEYDGRDQIRLWRGTLYTGGWGYILGRRVRLFYDAFWQPAFHQRQNYRTQFDIGLEVPVWKGLAFNVLYTFTHEHVVVQKVRQNDQLLSFGLAYQLRKSCISKWQSPPADK